MTYPGRIAALCILGATGLVLVNAWAPVTAWLIPTPGAPASLEEGAGDLGGQMDSRVSMIDGRSLFFEPAAPPPPAPPVVEREDPGPPPAPPPPSRYGGPKLIAMINGKAWFNNGSRLGVDDSEGDLTIKQLNPPWEAVVTWKDVEFTVNLFERDQIVLPNRPETVASTDDALPILTPEATPAITPEDAPEEPLETATGAAGELEPAADQTQNAHATSTDDPASSDDPDADPPLEDEDTP